MATYAAASIFWPGSMTPTRWHRTPRSSSALGALLQISSPRYTCLESIETISPSIRRQSSTATLVLPTAVGPTTATGTDAMGWLAAAELEAQLAVGDLQEGGSSVRAGDPGVGDLQGSEQGLHLLAAEALAELDRRLTGDGVGGPLETPCLVHFGALRQEAVYDVEHDPVEMSRWEGRVMPDQPGGAATEVLDVEPGRGEVDAAIVQAGGLDRRKVEQSGHQHRLAGGSAAAPGGDHAGGQHAPVRRVLVNQDQAIRSLGDDVAVQDLADKAEWPSQDPGTRIRRGQLQEQWLMLPYPMRPVRGDIRFSHGLRCHGDHLTRGQAAGGFRAAGSRERGPV